MAQMLIGYRVEDNTVEEAAQNAVGDRLMVAPYRLHGPRGARYALLRNAKNPEIMFAIHDRPGKFGCVTVKGNTWFTDRNGTLEVLS